MKALWKSAFDGSRFASEKGGAWTETDYPPNAPSEKLHLLVSPVVDRNKKSKEWSPQGDGEKNGDGNYGFESDTPQLRKYEEPTLLEIFFDLFLAANFSNFTETQRVTDHARFKAFIGYFCLLWTTWFLVTVYDVRYVTDSVFSRMTRAVQLGVLVGFVVVAPRFNLTDQDSSTMRTMSAILAVSRACLAVEYGSTLWHLRAYKKTCQVPLLLQMGIHTVTAAVYLGITFSFKNHGTSHVYLTWYFFTAAESLGSILLSNFWPVLSLTRTHLMKRLTLLTVIILGDGILVLSREVVVIVKGDGNWDALTIGLITAAATTVYFLFMLYFDWMRGCFYLPALRQQIWTILHLPFHLALVLHLQSFTQWLIWSKIFSLTNKFSEIVTVSISDVAANTTSLSVADSMNTSIQAIFHDYPPKIADTQTTINQALRNLTALPDGFWPVVAESWRDGDYALANASQEDQESLATYFDAATVILSSLSNVLFSAFKINGEEEHMPQPTHGGPEGALQLQVTESMWNLCRLVFAYGYISAGCTIILMTMIALVARMTPLKAWHRWRLAIVVLLALGTGFTATLWFNEELSQGFLQGPWVLPTITIVWATILLVTHINGPGIGRAMARVRRR